MFDTLLVLISAADHDFLSTVTVQSKTTCICFHCFRSHWLLRLDFQLACACWGPRKPAFVYLWLFLQDNWNANLPLVLLYPWPKTRGLLLMFLESGRGRNCPEMSSHVISWASKNQRLFSVLHLVLIHWLTTWCDAQTKQLAPKLTRRL